MIIILKCVKTNQILNVIKREEYSMERFTNGGLREERRRRITKGKRDGLFYGK